MKTRRKFIKSLATSSIGLGALSSVNAFNILPEFPVKDTYRIAVVGTNGRGAQHIVAYSSLPNTEVAYVCDVDTRAIESGINVAVTNGQKNKPKGLTDFRKVLDDKSIDAISIATPDHWHVPASLLALKAGKHVYVEKPGSHNPAEAELLSTAIAKYGKVVQMGNQRRSWPRVREAMRELHGGVIGKVYYARAWYTNNRPSIGIGKETAIPSWLDYELWQGPAPRKKFKDNLIHYNWHWFWNWGTGELLNNGTHFIDLARWGLQVNYPSQVFSTGGRFQYSDDWQTPDTQLATFEFENGKIIQWEGRSCNTRRINEMGSGVSFHGELGTLELLDNSYKIYDKENKLIKSADPEIQVVTDLRGNGFDMDKDHFINFINGIDTGESLRSHYPEISKSVLLCQLGNISYRVGRSLQIDATNGKIKNDVEAMKYWAREYEKGWEPTL